MVPDARFRLASVTKPVLSALFMALVEDGVFDLAAPITDYLPSFRPRLASGEEPVITLHHLMTHSSGLGYRFLESEDGPYALAGVADGLDQPGVSFEENLARLASAPLYFPPGQGWRYSVGLDVLGAAAEAATGRPLQALLDDKISGPLGLTSLAFYVPPSEDDLVVPYVSDTPEPHVLGEGERVPLWDEGGVTFLPSRAYSPDAFPSAGGGLVGTAPDLMTFFQTILAGGGPILRPDTVARMLQNQLPEGQFTMHGPGWGFGYGWGVLVEPQGPAAHLPRGLVRWGGVYGHSWFMDPGAGRISLLLTNTIFEGMSGRLSEEVPRAFYG